MKKQKISNRHEKTHKQGVSERMTVTSSTLQDATVPTDTKHHNITRKFLSCTHELSRDVERVGLNLKEIPICWGRDLPNVSDLCNRAAMCLGPKYPRVASSVKRRDKRI